MLYISFFHPLILSHRFFYSLFQLSFHDKCTIMVQYNEYILVLFKCSLADASPPPTPVQPKKAQELQDKEDALTALEADLSQRERAVQERVEMVAKKEAMIEASREETEHAQRQLVGIEQSCNEMRSTLHDLEKKLEKRRVELAKREATVQAETDRLDEARRSLQALEASLMDEQAEMKRTHEVAEVVIERERTELAALKVTLEQKEKMLNDKEDELAQRDAEATATALAERARLDEMKVRLDGMSKELDESGAIARVVNEQAKLALEKRVSELDGFDNLLKSKSKDLEDKENILAKQQKEMEAKQVESDRKFQDLMDRSRQMTVERDEQQKKLDQLAAALSVKETTLELTIQESRSLEVQLKEAQSKFQESELFASTSRDSIDQKIPSAISTETTMDGVNEEGDDEKKEPTGAAEMEGPIIPNDDTDRYGGTPLSEANKRRRMIDDELARIIRDAEEQELDGEMDPEAIDALTKAAYKICYVKKYYDVYKDKVIYFPSIVKTVMNYDLMEEADKYYGDEGDELPMQISAGLRSIAVNILADATSNGDDDVDEEYMENLASNVELE